MRGAEKARKVVRPDPAAAPERPKAAVGLDSEGRRRGP
jgi:hypothetical protein